MRCPVQLLLPNLIGYVRVILLLWACWCMPTRCWCAVTSYLLSALLDAFDGYAARRLNQSTGFGAMLDMLVDRCSTMCLLVCLSYFYPSYMFWFQISMLIDITSHWLHMHSSILRGGLSHKVIDLSANRVLRIYYHNKVVLFLTCAGNELFHSILYIGHFYPGPTVFGFPTAALLACLLAPVAIAKITISLIQLIAASANMAAIDEIKRAGVHEE